MFVLDQVYLGNSLTMWTVAFVSAVAIYTVLSVLRRTVGNRLKKMADKTDTDLDDFIADIVQVRTKKILFLALAIYGSSLFLTLPPDFERVLLGVVFFLLFLQVGLWGNGMINFFVTRKAAKRRRRGAKPGGLFRSYLDSQGGTLGHRGPAGA